MNHLGRIKTKKIKRITRDIISKYGNLMCETFDENKTVINGKITVRSKKLRNVISGYATRLTKNQEKL